MKRIAHTINKMKAQIILLQETHLKTQEGPVLKLSRFTQQYAAAGSSKARGVAVLISDSVRFQCTDFYRDPRSRFVFIKGALEGQAYTIGLVYTPNADQLQFLEDMFVHLLGFQDGHQIVGGG